MGKGTEGKSRRSDSLKRQLLYWIIVSMCASAACWMVFPRKNGDEPLKLIPVHTYRPDVVEALNPGVETRILVYPYSVIPGGAHSPQELKEAVLRDATVRQHYSDFDLAQTRVVHLSSAKLAYVSYRIHNQIFWTSHKVHLHDGEALLTDGVHYARTRCGNQVSETPRQPIAPRIEPESAEMEKPQQVVINHPPDGTSIAPVSATRASEVPLPGGATPDGPLPGNLADFIPPSPPLSFINHPKSRNSIPPIPPGGDHIPSPTPEPGTLLMLGSGVAYLVGRKFKRG